MPGDYFFLNYGVQDGNVMQGLFRVEKTTLELQVYNGTQWVAVAGGGGGSTSATVMSTVQRMAFVPASGALIWDTDLERLFIGNSLTAGGIDTTDTNVKSLTTTERMAMVPKQGELIWDTTLGALFIGDGSTQGGVSIGGGGGSGIIAGTRLDFDGDTLNFNPVKEIINVTGNSATFVPDTAYKIYATTGAFNVTANPPAANYWGLEGHAEIFVGSVGYVVFDTSKIVLANQLESDSVNNCTLRFHDGMCYIFVEDHIAGYIVVNGSTSGDGSLYYGITTSTNDYVAFDASLNGSTIPLAGAVAEGEKHIVGNGYTETQITGAVDCGTSKVTVANLGLNNVQITGGVMTFGDAFIPSGSTVAVSGGGLAVEKVTGAGEGSVINLGNTRLSIASNTTANASGVVFTGGNAGDGQNGGVFNVAGGAQVNISGCTASGNIATRGGVFSVSPGGIVSAVSCAFIGNTGSTYAGVLYGTANATFSSCTFTGNTCINNPGNAINNGGTTTLVDCTLDGVVNGSGSAVISGTIDLTGNTNATPIKLGGGIVIYGGPSSSPTTIIGSAGSAAQTRTIEDVEIRGTSISKIGAIYGATTTSVPGDGYFLTYTTDNGSTSSTVVLNDTAPTDVPAQYGSSAAVLRVFKENS